MSRYKEPKFFALQGHSLDFKGPFDDRFRRGTTTDVESYLALFEQVKDEKVIGEASTIYLGDSRAPGAIAKQIPDARILAILRHPAERAFSAHQHLLRDGYEPLTRFEDALEAEHQRAADGWYIQYQYKGRGFYGKYLKQYYDRFDPGQIRIYLYEDFVYRPEWMLEDLFKFLGVDAGFRPVTASRHNISGRARSARLQRWLTRTNPVKEALKKWIPEQWGHRLIYRVQLFNVVRSRIDPETRKCLMRDYRDDIKLLENLIGRDLSGWFD
jgi:hypothetical protein